MLKSLSTSSARCESRDRAAVLVSAVIDFLVTQRVWRAENPISVRTPPLIGSVAPARKSSTGKVIAIGCGGMLALGVLPVENLVLGA